MTGLSKVTAQDSELLWFEGLPLERKDDCQVSPGGGSTKVSFSSYFALVVGL